MPSIIPVRRVVLRPPQSVTAEVFLGGPGDTVGGAVAYWGGESYNIAYATGTNPCWDIVDTATGLIPTTINIKTSGRADVAAINALGYAVSITKAYDQTGNGNHLTQSTLAAMPTIEVSGSNARMVFATGQYLAKSGWNGAADVAPPWTISGFYIDTGTVDADGGSLLSTSAAGHASLYSNPDGTPNLVRTFAASNTDATATNGVWHSVSGICNGTASADTNVDGVITLGNPGTRNLRQTIIYLGADDTPANFIGKIGRMGVWATEFTSGNSSSMSTQDHAFWGV